MSGNLYELMVSRFPAERSRTAIETAGGRPVTYRTIERTAGCYARCLQACGVVKGYRVAVQIDKSVEGLCLYLATLQAGAVYLPLNTAYTRAEVGYFLSDARPRVLVCQPESRDVLAMTAAEAGVAEVLTLGAAGEGSLPAQAEALEPEPAAVPVAPDDLAAILYTSGTTGRSKGAMLTHSNLASNAETLVQAWGFTEADILLHILPIYHVHGLFVATHCAWLSGARMVFLPRFDADQVIELLPRVTTMMGVPTHYTRLLAHPGLDRERCQGMRLFISGSAPLLAETHRAFEDRTGHAILERYGMTETVMNTSNPLDGDRIPGTVGPPLPGVEIRAVGEDGRVLPPGEIGMLEVRGPNVFKGYWQMPEKTAAEFREDGFFITGDLGLIDDRGYVAIVGRGKDLIISGGLNVYPKEVESVVDELDGVLESAVIGVPHADFGEGVVAVVVPAYGRPGPDEAAVLGWLRTQLAAFKTPKRVIFVEELPRNTMGKVQKAELRERYKDILGEPAA
jgi:malonyl-CoA/methylmalonyl-CoA synthetase